MAGLRSYSSMGICLPGAWRSVAPQAKARVNLILHLRVAPEVPDLLVQARSPQTPLCLPKEGREEAASGILGKIALVMGCSSNLNSGSYNPPGPQPHRPLPTSYLWFCSIGFTLSSFVQCG